VLTVDCWDWKLECNLKSSIFCLDGTDAGDTTRTNKHDPLAGSAVVILQLSNEERERDRKKYMEISSGLVLNRDRSGKNIC
jgi:hypothetical protein